MAEIVLRKIFKIFADGTIALRDFSLEVADRELVVLVGPSGCGKSTTLRIIAGLEKASAGTIVIGGCDVNEVAPKDRDIAMVFQNYSLYPHMSVFDNMAFGLKMRGVPKAQIGGKVREAAGLLNIAHLLTRKPSELSGGERQRVAVGRALVRDPQCFLFDEPLSNLDARLRLEMRAEIKRLHLELMRTAVYVTHDQEEAMTLGDRVVVMRAGEVQQCGPPLEIYHRPANRFVAGFVGTPPINFLEGRIAAENGALWFEQVALRLPVPGWAIPSLAGSVNQSVVLGIRPQAITTAIGPGTEEWRLETKVLLVEPLGDKMNVHLETASQSRIVAHIDPDTRIRPGQQVSVAIDPVRLHFFEAGQGGRSLVKELPEAAVPH